MNRVKRISRRWGAQRSDALAVLGKNKADTNRRRRAEEKRQRQQSPAPLPNQYQAFGEVDGQQVVVTFSEEASKQITKDAVRGLTHGVVEATPVDDAIEDIRFLEASLEVDPKFYGPGTSVSVVPGPDEVIRQEVERLTAMTRDELVAVYKRWGLTGHSKKNKTQLIDAIVEAWATENHMDIDKVKEWTK